jgi:toxin HigB-1
LRLVSYYDTRGAMIRSFRGSFAELIFALRRIPKGFPTDVAKVARRKLVQLNNATTLGDLVAPPGNRLEALRGDLAGKHSIRINDQWRIVFRWSDQGPEEVEIMDYH